ncbi:MAG: glycosyltransferase family 92 protein [Bacteroidales bacterium]|nr:glycosyltransferase family 92 protein [Bacteroidales bacterium]
MANFKSLEKNLILEINASTEKSLKNYVKYILSYFLDVWYNILLLLKGNKIKNNKKQFYVSACAIFKDESPFLREWIEYHKLIGIEHFYMYNNFSSDNYKQVLEPYINSGLVTLKEWPYECGQISAYEDCYLSCRSSTNWLTYIDIDEYICPYYKHSIKEWLIKYEKYPSVILYWKMFGSSGKIEHDYNQFLIEQYTNSWEKLYGVGKHIMNTSYTPVKIYHHYLFSYVNFLGFKFKMPSINEYKYFVPYTNLHRSKANHTIQLNHYWSKAYNEYIKKKLKGDVFYPKEVQTRTHEILMNFEKKNIHSDYKIFKYLLDLKLSISKSDEI